ncbi:MAG TPA: hypothetical protein VIV12_17790, partial [Streptosporangiaceae bacterium]
YRLAWARTLLKNMGAIVNDGPCQWSITASGRQMTSDDIQQFAKEMLDKLAEYSRNQQAARARAGS